MPRICRRKCSCGKIIPEKRVKSILEDQALRPDKEVLCLVCQKELEEAEEQYYQAINVDKTVRLWDKI